MGAVKLLLAAGLALTLGLPRSDPSDRLYGRVTTAGGRSYEGYLRLDRNEGSWADVLDGLKELPRQNLRDAERLDAEHGRRSREHSIDLLGLHISWNEGGDAYPSRSSSGVRFGHLRSLEVWGRERALLTLKSGEEVELQGGSTDLGEGLGRLVVEDPERGTVELGWRDLEEVEFKQAPAEAGSPGAERMHGTLRTRDGLEFTGFVAWDQDEILLSDVLDGDEQGQKREIPFHAIAAIERDGRSGATVLLSNGEELHLRGSNDVDERNRGIAVSDPSLGQVVVGWRDFADLRLHEPTSPAGRYVDFDGGRALWGTVRTEDGREVTGYVRWDNDEQSTWEMLDGRAGDVDFDIEFGYIEHIRRLGTWGCEVTLRDGRQFELEGSNDVDDGNKGIFVTPADGETVLIPWWDFAELTLAP